MDNRIFVNNENIPLVTHYDKNRDDDNDYNNYHTSNTSGVDETAFTMPGSTEKQATSTLSSLSKP